MRMLLRRLVLALVANGFAVWAVSQIFPDRFQIFSDPVWLGFVVVGIAVGVLNTFVKPIIKILSLPFVILTMGLFLILINGIIIWIVEWLFQEVLTSSTIQVIVEGGVVSYILIGFALGVINTILHWLLKEKK